MGKISWYQLHTKYASNKWISSQINISENNIDSFHDVTQEAEIRDKIQIYSQLQYKMYI